MVDVEFRPVESGHKYVNRSPMARERDWMKVLGKAADRKGGKKEHIKSTEKEITLMHP